MNILWMWLSQFWSYVPSRFCPHFLGHSVVRSVSYITGQYWPLCTEFKMVGAIVSVHIFHSMLHVHYFRAKFSFLIQEMLVTSNYRKSPYAYKKLQSLWGARFMGNGLVTQMDPVKWEKTRNMFNPAFHRRLVHFKHFYGMNQSMHSSCKCSHNWHFVVEEDHRACCKWVFVLRWAEYPE